MESDGDHFLAYYLTKEDPPAELLKDSRFLDDAKNLVLSFVDILHGTLYLTYY